MNRILALLEAMDRLPDDERGASFRCVLALASPEGAVRPVEGACRGRILRAPRGSGGFGYDPVFLLPELKRTMAELSLKEKGRVSHRARALDALEPLLRELSSGAPRHG